MKNLRIGDKVLTMNSEGKRVYSDVTMFLHVNRNVSTDAFITISIKDGNIITMTALHLIHVFQNGFIFAKDVKQGNEITVYDSTAGKFQKKEVRDLFILDETDIIKILIDSIKNNISLCDKDAD